MSDIIILSAYHKKNEIIPNNDWIKPISCGSFQFDNKDNLLSDNIKDNISHLNDVYAELTCHYWMWKNISDKNYYGLCHYRRYLNFSNCEIYNINDIIKESQKKEAYIILKEYDMIIPEAIQLGTSIEEQYKGCKPAIHWDLYIEIICSLYPKYSNYIDFFKTTNHLHACNIFLANKEVFNNYSEELFNISNLFYKNITYPKNQPDKRYVGYLSERFLNLYINVNKIKYKQVKMETIN